LEQKARALRTANSTLPMLVNPERTHARQVTCKHWKKFVQSGATSLAIQVDHDRSKKDIMLLHGINDGLSFVKPANIVTIHTYRFAKSRKPLVLVVMDDPHPYALYATKCTWRNLLTTALTTKYRVQKHALVQ